jgi:hypothetical protein
VADIIRIPCEGRFDRKKVEKRLRVFRFDEKRDLSDRPKNRRMVAVVEQHPEARVRAAEANAREIARGDERHFRGAESSPGEHVSERGPVIGGARLLDAKHRDARGRVISGRVRAWERRRIDRGPDGRGRRDRLINRLEFGA